MSRGSIFQKKSPARQILVNLHGSLPFGVGGLYEEQGSSCPALIATHTKWKRTMQVR
jgi:hypothetical protein